MKAALLSRALGSDDKDKSLDQQVLTLLRRASHPKPTKMTCEMRVNLMCEATHLLTSNRSEIKQFGDTDEEFQQSVDDIKHWTVGIRRLMAAHTFEDLQKIIQKYWGDMNLIIRTPNKRRSEARVRKAFRNAAMCRLFEVSTNVLGDATEAKRCEKKTTTMFSSLEADIDRLTTRIAQLEAFTNVSDTDGEENCALVVINSEQQ